MSQVVLVDGLRIPFGKSGGRWAGWRPDDLLGQTLRALLDRHPELANAPDEIVVGCVHQVGEQSLNIARQASFRAGIGHQVPSYTVNRACASGLDAVGAAVAAVASGRADTVVAAGVESLSRIPLGASAQSFGSPHHPQWVAAVNPVSQGQAADLVARRWGLERSQLDRYGIASHDRAWKATASGRLAGELFSFDGGERRDEGIRQTVDPERVSRLSPAFGVDGITTAATSSQVSDGAAAVLVMSKERARALTMEWLAEIRAVTVAADDPRLMLTATIPATRKLMNRLDWGRDLALYEVNEAFASAVLAWQTEIGADLNQVNAWGGAIAIGHPLGASGVRLVLTLARQLQARGGGRGIATMCAYGGQAVAVGLES